MRRIVWFWLLLAATLALYLVIVLWSLPRIAGQAAGLAPFDMRPLGYAAQEARAFLTALTTQGRDWYLGTQHRLDLAYPALLAATLALPFTLLARSPALRAALVLLAVAVAGFDWLENHAVAGLLRTDPAAVTDDQIAAAARWTLAKSLATTAAFTAVLALALAALIRRRSRP